MEDHEPLSHRLEAVATARKIICHIGLQRHEARVREMDLSGRPQQAET